jgi:hypothetical protein
MGVGYNPDETILDGQEGPHYSVPTALISYSKMEFDLCHSNLPGYTRSTIPDH